MSHPTLQEIRAAYDTADCLYSKADVERAYDRMAAALTARLAAVNPVVLPIMVGGLIPAGQLLPRLAFPLQIGYLHASRYRDQTEGGTLEWRVPPSNVLEDRVVLLIDDILDEGLTLAAVKAACREARAREVHTAVLLDKRHARKNGFTADFVGLEVEDRYVFGCGMDYRGYWRNLPAVYALSDRMTAFGDAKQAGRA